MTRLFALLITLVLPCFAMAQDFDNIVKAQLRPGWRMANGDHMAALHLSLAPGWKTYWRAPGDAGIPPSFDWQRTRNIADIAVQWPAPVVFHQAGMRSVGYKGEVILPLRIRTKTAKGNSHIEGVIDLGLCKDVCLPHRLTISAALPADLRKPDPMIAAALANLPFGPQDAQVRQTTCEISPAPSGLNLRVSIDMPRGTGREETVIETADPNLWVADPETRWQGSTLIAQTRVTHQSAPVFALDRSSLRITVLGGQMPLDIQGCSAG